jgi:hypothetical protein
MNELMAPSRRRSIRETNYWRGDMEKPESVYVSYLATTPKKLWSALTDGEFTTQYWFGRRVESDWRKGSRVSFWVDETHALDISGEPPPKPSHRDGGPSGALPSEHAGVEIVATFPRSRRKHCPRNDGSRNPPPQR